MFASAKPFACIWKCVFSSLVGTWSWPIKIFKIMCDRLWCKYILLWGIVYKSNLAGSAIPKGPKPIQSSSVWNGRVLFLFFNSLILNTGLAWLKSFKIIWSFFHKCVICFFPSLKMPLTWRPLSSRIFCARITSSFKGVILGKDQEMTDCSVMIWCTMDLKCSSGFSIIWSLVFKKIKGKSVISPKCIFPFLYFFFLLTPSVPFSYGLYFPSSNYNSVHWFGNLDTSFLMTILWAEVRHLQFGQGFSHLWVNVLSFLV